jgi:hypothetical protein
MPMRTHHAYAGEQPESNDNFIQPFIQSPVHSHVEGEGGFEQDFAINPPGLRGLNRLTVRLNGLMRSGTISNWHLGRWKNRPRTLHSVLFSTARELNAARLGAL